MSVEPSMVVLEHKVCSTRNAARGVIESRPDASPGMAVYLRCDRASAPDPSELPANIRALYEQAGIEPSTERGVEVMTPSFAHEILKAWPKAQLVGANPEVQATFEFVRGRHG
jgi:hypothetical protein